MQPPGFARCRSSAVHGARLSEKGVSVRVAHYSQRSSTSPTFPTLQVLASTPQFQTRRPRGMSRMAKPISVYGATEPAPRRQFTIHGIHREVTSSSCNALNSAFHPRAAPSGGRCSTTRRHLTVRLLNGIRSPSPTNSSPGCFIISTVAARRALRVHITLARLTSATC